jgi:hypothetical protein
MTVNMPLVGLYLLKDYCGVVRVAGMGTDLFV